MALPCTLSQQWGRRAGTLDEIFGGDLDGLTYDEIRDNFPEECAAEGATVASSEGAAVKEDFEVSNCAAVRFNERERHRHVARNIPG